MKIAISLIVLMVLLGFGIYAALDYQDKNFAAKYFSFMSYERVLASKKWHNDALGCTYAIVSLDDSTPIDPPDQWIDRAVWTPTPMRFKEGTNKECRNLICSCEADLNSVHYQVLTRALTEKGSFYSFGGREPPFGTLSQGVVLIYSSEERVAARVRFGD